MGKIGDGLINRYSGGKANLDWQTHRLQLASDIYNVTDRHAPIEIRKHWASDLMKTCGASGNVKIPRRYRRRSHRKRSRHCWSNFVTRKQDKMIYIKASPLQITDRHVGHQPKPFIPVGHVDIERQSECRRDLY